VALGDVGVEQPFPNHVAYLAAKGAVRGVVSALAADLAPDVRVNGVAVGVVTDTASAPSDARTSRLAARSRLGRMGTPEEVARVVVAQLEATWVTGAFWTVGT
jgi:pteridine reductase